MDLVHEQGQPPGNHANIPSTKRPVADEAKHEMKRTGIDLDLSIHRLDTLAAHISLDFNHHHAQADTEVLDVCYWR